MPRFSIVVPAYNAEETLAETLDAILAQEFEEWECIVVDDGSADGTAVLARSYSQTDSRVRVVSQENQGTAGAYDTGVRESTGELIIICSADDILLPAHLARMNEFITENPGCDIFSSNGYLLFPDGRTEVIYSDSEMHDRSGFSFAEVVENCFFGVGASYRATLWQAVGGYRRGAYGEDWDFWLRAMALGAHHGYSPTLTAVHRIGPTQKSAAWERMLESDILILRNLLDEFALSDEITLAAEGAIRHRETQLARVPVNTFREALDREDWRVARRAFPQAFRFLAINPKWWLGALLLYVAPERLKSLLMERDRSSGGTG